MSRLQPRKQILCACNCGEYIVDRDKKNRPRSFVPGHHVKLQDYSKRDNSHLLKYSYKKGNRPWIADNPLYGKENPFYGKKHTDETKKIIGEKVSKAMKSKTLWNWKGDSVGYDALHDWVKRQLGSAQRCDFDNSHTAFQFHWANVSGSYLRDLGDWIQLCPKCHKEYDTLRHLPASRVFTIKNKHGRPKRRTI